MTFDLAIVLFLMLATFTVMVWEKVSVDVAALCSMGLLILTGVLEPKEAFSVFSNEAAITVASMFVISAALIRTGALESATRLLDRLGGGGTETRLLLVVLPLVALLSAFVNNTPIVVMFMPLLIALATKHRLNQSALLLPLSYASIFGGLCTLIGTSTTILVSSTAQRLGQAPITMFEVTPLGIAMLIVGFAFVFAFGRRLLPARSSLSQKALASPRHFLTELIVTEDSPWIDQPLAKTPLAADGDLNILDVRRQGGTVAVPLGEIRLKAGDILRVTGSMQHLVGIQTLPGLQLKAEHRYAQSMLDTQTASSAPADVATRKSALPSEALRLVECIVSHSSPLVGRSVRDLDFRRRYSVLVIALHRRGGDVMERDFSRLPLEPGDSLLLEGEEQAISRLEADDDFLVLNRVTQRAPRRSKRIIALSLAVAVVILATVGVLPIAALALIAAVLCVLFRCLDPHEAYEAIEWRIIMLIFGMLSLGLALEKTGGAKLAAEGILHLFQDAGPWVVLSVVLLLCSTLTEFLSNNAVGVLFTPIVINIADQIGVDARPFLMAVVLGASASFATPIGYQTNTLVYGAGGYRFSDFLRVGVPLNIVVWLVGSLLIPLFWPFVAK